MEAQVEAYRYTQRVGYSCEAQRDWKSQSLKRWPVQMFASVSAAAEKQALASIVC